MNKDLSKAIKDAVILEVDRYISCASLNEEREKAYPRRLLEERLVEQVENILKGDKC